MNPATLVAEMRRFLGDSKTGIATPFALGLAATAVALACASRISAQTITRDQAARAAIHPVASVAELRTWLARVPATHDFPPDFDETLRGQAQLYALEMSTEPGCAPCADLWGKLLSFRARYGWQIRTISVNEAMLRSGRLGLPWVGNPVVWARPNNDPSRMVPIAIGTDHAVNIARNAYLAAKMLTGVRVAIAVRGMSKFTGLVGAGAPARPSNPRR